MDFWEKALCHIEKRVSRKSFDVWFKPTLLEKQDLGQRKLFVGVPNEHFRYWLTANYGDVIRWSLRDAKLDHFEVVFCVKETQAGGSEVTELESAQAHQREVGSNLNPKYTFGHFVVGLSNQFAHAATLAVAENPCKAYNPLFVYGGVGLGKTHLMHAIGHCIKTHTPQIRLTYMSSERFTNELINSIRYDKTPQFREKYRNIDVLLMDDIQFLAGKERTQEEFFHTFNALYDSQKQIVISSDSPPRDIPTLEERLHSRFEWGLIADIQPPELETKIAILRKKAELEQVEVPDDVAFFIASNIKSNVRELEGSLVRLAAYCSLTGCNISLDLAQKVLRSITETNSRFLSIESIQKVVAEQYGLRVTELKARNNARRVAEPRQIAMYLVKHLTDSSLPQIGREFGGKHHTTVLHSVRKIQALRRKDRKLDHRLNRLIDLIQ